MSTPTAPTIEQMLALAEAIEKHPWYYMTDCPSISGDDFGDVAKAIRSALLTHAEVVKERDGLREECRSWRGLADDALCRTEKAEAANVPAGTPTDDEKAIARLSRANALAYYERKRRKPSTCQSEFADDDKALAHLRSRLATRRVSREWLYDFVRFIYGHYEAGLAIPIADKLRSLGIEVADV